MIRTYKLISVLLSYPEDEIRDSLPEIVPLLRQEAILSEREISGIKEFISFFSSMDMIEWQEHYVQLFDTSRHVSLYLFEHVHGDSKDRGQAMVDLLDLYKANGFNLGVSELPDYLPVFLEFISMLSEEKAAEMLGETTHILSIIHAGLKGSDNPYQHILAAILYLVPKQQIVKSGIHG